MIKIELKDYLLTGELGPLKWGVTKGDVISVLGTGGNIDPPQEHRKRRPQFSSWKYGPLELHFERDTLIQINFGFYIDESLPEQLSTDGYFPNPETTVDEFLNYLRSEGIAYENDPRWTIPGHQMSFVIGDGEVLVLFLEKQG